MKRVHYSWVILFLTFFSIIVAGIVRSSSGVFVIPFEEEFQWNRSMISFAFGLSLFIYGFSGPFMGAIVQSVGIKKMMLLSMGTLMLSLLLSLFMTEPWQLILVWGVLNGLGASLFLTVLSPMIANTWFVKSRGLAVGILTASTATGQLLLLPLLAYVIEVSNWKNAITIIFILSMVMFILIIFLMKDSPKRLGIPPYGGQEETQTEAIPQPKTNPFKMALDVLFHAFKYKEFWLLAGSFFVCGLSTSGLIGTHFVSLCVSFGIAAVTAASFLSIMGVFDLVGTTASGWLSDRVDNRWLLFWYYGLRGLSLLLLPFALSQGSYTMLIIFTVFYGLDWIATVPPTINIARNVFGLEKSVIIYGWIFAAHQVGAAVAAYGGGVLFEQYNTYIHAYIGAGVFCFLASLFVILIKKEHGSTKFEM